MSVNPGFGGQKFLPLAFQKLLRLKEMFGPRPVELSVDGGVKADNAGKLAEHGATVLVAGSAIFGAPDPAAAIRSIRAATS
jgi:ribulose-phosphate 3-epimerase